MNNKNINYQKVLQNTLKQIEIEGKRPKLLLHVCCGPCFTIPYEILKNHFDITIFYNNSNIYPKEEYERRFIELLRYLHSINRDDIKVIEVPYEPDEFIKYLEPYKELKEGYERCRVCFKNRLEPGFIHALENGFDYFGTVMTISRYKNAKDINLIGEKLQEKYPTIKWLYADFKKNDGYEKSLVICRENDLYFQQYCGCKFSYQKSQKID